MDERIAGHRDPRTGRIVRRRIALVAAAMLLFFLVPAGEAFAAEWHTVSVSAWDLLDSTDDRGTTVDRPWELWHADGRGVPSKSWGTAFSASRYVEYVLPAVVPSGTAVSTVTLTHVYANQVSTSTQAKIAVWDGSSWAEYPLTVASGTGWVTDVVQLPILKAPAKANAAKIRFYAANSGGVSTSTDQVRLTVEGNQGTFEAAPDTVSDRSDGVPLDRSPDLVADDGIAYQTRDVWPSGAFMADRYVEFSIGPVVAPGSVVESVRIDVTRNNQKGRMSLVARLDVFDGAKWTTHALSPDRDTEPVSDAVLAPEIDDAGKLERMRIRFLAYSPNGQTGKTRHDRLVVTVTYRTPEWSYRTGAAALGNPAAYPITNALYGGSNDGGVRSFSFAEGRRRWELKTAGPVQNQTVVRVAGQVRVFAGSQDGYLYALDDAGDRLWTVPAAGDYDPATKTFAAPGPQDHLQGGVAYRANVRMGSVMKNALFVGTYNTGASDNAFYAIDAANGAVLWRDGRPGSEYVNSYPAVDWTTGRVIYTTYAGAVRAVDASGSLSWERALGAAIAGSPTLWGDLVLVGTNDGKLHMLRLSDGATRRVVQPSVGAYTMGTPWPGATTYISSSKGSVYAVETSTGAVLAEGSGLDWPRLPVVYDTKVYVGTNSGLYVLDKTTLAKVGTYRVGYAVASPALDVAAGRLFFGDSSGRYYAVGMGSVGPALSGAAAPPVSLGAASAPAPAATAASVAPTVRTARAGTTRATRARNARERGARGSRGVSKAKARARAARHRAAARSAVAEVRMRNGSLLVTVRGGARLRAAADCDLTLMSPDGGVYGRFSGRVSPSRRSSRAPIIVWQVPVAGTWAGGLPGRWTATGTLAGKALNPGSEIIE